jgi:formylglycine-generating enzyme
MQTTLTSPLAPGRPPARDMVWIPGGTFLMGSNDHYEEEAPAHKLRVNGFWIDKYLVTNAQFQKFVKATDYATTAERPANPEDYPGADPALLQPASIVFTPPPSQIDMGNHYNWWNYVRGANWRHPEGPGSNIKGREKHPVVHVTFEDALAYAAWAGKALPTEAEWELAGRGGLEDKEFAWGDELYPKGRFMANTFQGQFPYRNSCEDGYERTSPVGSFPANGYGLYDMIGNVWEWTVDWYQEHNQIEKPPCCTMDNPRGGNPEASHDPNLKGVQIPRRLVKGGSYLCTPDYCKRYRPAARMAQGIDTSTGHMGFRCIVRV